jgi:hypothetical protein
MCVRRIEAMIAYSTGASFSVQLLSSLSLWVVTPVFLMALVPAAVVNREYARLTAVRTAPWSCGWRCGLVAWSDFCMHSL